MKKYRSLVCICLVFLFGFTPKEKTTDALIGIWINPAKDVKIKIEEVGGHTRAILFWSSKPEAKEHVGRIVIREIAPYGKDFKAQVIAPEKRKFVNALIEFKSNDAILITGFDQGKSISKLYRKVKV